MHQSWSSGGTARLLPRERARASFDVEALTHILDGGEAFTAKRRWIQGSHDRAFDDPGRAGRVVDHADRPRMALVAESMRHFMDVHWPHLRRGYRPKGQDMTFMSGAKFGNTGPLSLHYGVFMSTLRSQTSFEQRGWWVQPGMELQFIGCYAQTELGHGSNVRGLQTTATYDPATQEWVLHTPTLQSAKWWSTGMFSATHAAVYAQMILPGGVNKGVHVFFVQMRGADLKPLPGVEIGDIGPKLGDNDTPIGYLRLDRVRVPRRHLMEGRQHVTPDGRYVLGQPPSSLALQRQSQRAANATKAKAAAHVNTPPPRRNNNNNTPATKNVSHYITMLKTRIGLTNTAGSALAKAAVIATRYSAVRHQGFAPGTRRVMNDPELPILDYQVQLYRVLQWTSTAFAIKFVARWLLRRRKEAERTLKSGQGSNDDLPEVHASAAGLKALCCCLAADGIEDLRRACGGHGYLMSSGIAPLEADFKGPNTTAEGDYVVLALQTARFLLKMVDRAREGGPLPGTTQIFAPLRDDAAAASGAARPAPPPGDLVRILASTAEADARVARDYLTRLYAYRSLVRCASMSASYKAALAGARVRGAADPVNEARNANARAMQTAALAHVRFFMLSKFFEEVDTVAAGPERDVLHRLAVFYALQELANGGRGWAGIATAEDCAAADAAVDALCEALRPECVALVDAFDISDTVLNSALGKWDGNVYEEIFAAAKSSALNVTGHGEEAGVPACLRAVEQYLNGEFLRNGTALAEGGQGGEETTARGGGGGGGSGVAAALTGGSARSKL